VFLKPLWQTLTFALGSLVIGVPLALGLSFALSRARLQVGLAGALHPAHGHQHRRRGDHLLFVFRETDGLPQPPARACRAAGAGWLTDPSLAMLSAILVFV
jgi:ABC-type sugar transport system permease subunit